METWDLYNRNECLLGKDWNREQSLLLPEGCYHLVCEILVRHWDGEFLLMRRALTKSIRPGIWEATAGGSALKGETPLLGAKRELREETGLTTDAWQLVGRSVEDVKHGIYYSYVATVSGPKDEIQLQAGETIAVRWISAQELINWLPGSQMGKDRKERYAGYVASLKDY